MSRDINLSNVNISIQEFQRLSKGDYNAGEVKLSSETRLTKINNHVHRLRANNETISHAEVLTIKDAFIRALARSGVGREEIARVRAELGLAGTGPEDKTLTQRSIKPLTRQQIRQILDRNAQQINATANGTIVRTEAQLHAGRTAAKQTQVTQMRDAATASIHRDLDESRNITLYQRVFAGDIQHLSQDEQAQALKFAKTQRDAILQGCNNNPDNGPCSLLIATSSGARITLSADTTVAETVKRLDEEILRLSNKPAPREQDIAARNEFLAIGAGLSAEEREQARADWAMPLFARTANPLLVRTAVVTILQERGIQDEKALSLVNNVSDQNALSMLQTLLVHLRSYSGERLLNNQFMQAMASPVNAKEVPTANQAYIPTFTAQERNNAICRILGSSEPDRHIPFELEHMAADCRAIAAEHFGAEFVDNSDPVSGFAKNHELFGVCNAESAAGRNVTAETLRDTYLASGLKGCAQKFLAAAFQTLLPANGNADDTAARLARAFQETHPTLLQQLIDAGNPAAANEVLNGLHEELAATAQRGTTLDALNNGELNKMFQDCLTEELGLKGLSLNSEAANFSVQVKNNLVEFGYAIESGTHEAKTPEQIRAFFHDKAAECAHGRAGLLAKVDSLKLPAPQTENIKAIILSSGSVQGIDLDALQEAAKALDASGIVQALGNAGDNREAVYTAMHALGQTLHAHDNENPASAAILAQLAAARTPLLFDALNVFFARPEVQADLDAAQQAPKNAQPAAAAALPFLGAAAGTASTRAAVISSIGTANMSPLFAKALIDAVNDNKLGALPNAEKFALFAPDTEAGDALREAARAMPAGVALQPHHLKTMADAILARMDVTTLSKHAVAYAAYGEKVESAALAAGYHGSEVSTLCDTFRLYQKATGCSDADALSAVLNPQSPARHIYSFGGRFTESPENFSKGLTLLKQFHEWFPAVTAIIHQKTAVHPDLPGNPSTTILNADPHYFNSKSSYAYEKFLFEEIAINDELPLEAADPEQVFGMANNPATCFVGRAYVTACLNTVAQIPPQIRHLLYQVHQMLAPLDNTAKEANNSGFATSAPEFVGRFLRHLDEIRDMQKAGTLTRENYLNLFFADVPEPTFKTMKEIFNWYTNTIYNDTIAEHFAGDFSKMPLIASAMEVNGSTLAEAIEVVKNNLQLPEVPYHTNVASRIEDMNDGWKGGRAQAVLDLKRPSAPTFLSNGQSAIPKENNVFTTRFPDGTVLKTTQGQGAQAAEASANLIADKVEEFVGQTHPAQLNTVLLFLSQSGEGCVNKGFRAQGIESTEHTPLTYEFSRDDSTGAILIRYSMPEGFPLNAHWEARIALDGTSSTTPMVIEDAEA